MNNIKLGFFDSGVGGFTVLKSILTRHGDVNAVYLGDTLRLPYGKRSVSEIREIANEVVTWLNYQDISALIIACNTTNSLALDIVKQVSRVPIYGLLESVHETIDSSDTKVGVLSTPSTAFSGAYKKSIHSYKPNVTVFEQACPSLVPLIETGQLNSPELRSAAKNYLQPLIDNAVDSIILGCSHYPLIEHIFIDLLPDKIRLIDPSQSLAKKLDSYFGCPQDLDKFIPSFSNVQFCSTSDSFGFAARAQHWLGIDTEVKLVSLISNACVL